MDTFFASPERTSEENLSDEIDFVSQNPITSTLLNSVGGLLAIVDENRQVVALNDSILQMLGIDDPARALGLRPGEVIQCIHANDEPAGCGTTQFCSTCGAAIAMVSSMKQNAPVEKICALSTKKDNIKMDMVLLVRSHPIEIENRRFLMLFLQDITRQQQRAALERTFFHDINNTLTMMVWGSETLVEECPSDLARNLHDTSLRLSQEIAIQRSLYQGEMHAYQPMSHEITTERIISELQSFFSSHPAAHQKQLEFREPFPHIKIQTDFSLLSRILNNMIINALEASEKNEPVKIWFEHKADVLTFVVWNAQEIPQEVTHRIFQRNFSTKDQAGRGVGTFSMKLFGEEVLGGKVSFKTSREKGTVFRFSLPL